MVDILQSIALVSLAVTFVLHTFNDLRQTDDLYGHINERFEIMYNLISSKLNFK